MRDNARTWRIYQLTAFSAFTLMGLGALKFVELLVKLWEMAE